MKIRIKGNSVRYRLSKTDVHHLTVSGSIAEHTLFGTNTFTYALQKDEQASELHATFEQNTITMLVPAQLVQGWEENSIVGFDADMPLPGGQKLYLLLEKDFQCIDQTTEDQSDNYINPNQTC